MKQVLFVIFLSLTILTSCDKISSLISTNPNTYVEEGIIFMNSGQYTEAGIRFKSALKKDPEHFKANYAFGGLYKRTEHYDEAVKFLSKAVRINPKSEEAAIDLAYVFIQKKEYETAIKVLQPLSISPKNPEVYFYIGDSYHRKKDYISAEKWFKKAAKMIPLSNPKLLATTYGLLGDSLLALKKFDEAEKILTDAAKLTKSPLVTVKLGSTLFSIGNIYHVQVLGAKKKIEALNEEINKKRGRAKKKLKKKKEGELKDLNTKLEFNTTHRNLAITKAKKYLGEILKDTKKLNKGTKREALYYLGMSHLILSEHVDAKTYLVKFLRNDPKGPAVTEVRALVGKLDELILREEQAKLDKENKGKGE